jgi:GntR family transcriptional regulator / MocR family aminotransferase
MVRITRLWPVSFRATQHTPALQLTSQILLLDHWRAMGDNGCMDLGLNLDKRDDAPVYRQLYLQIRRLILDGRLPPGTRLPASRKLAQEYGLGRVTVTAAYGQLEAEGFVESRVGAGTFVVQLADPLPAGEETIPFRPALSRWGSRVQHAVMEREPTGEPPRGNDLEIEFGFGRSFPHIFPYDIWRRLLARYLSTDDAMLSRYGSEAGFFPLRRAVAHYLAAWRGVRAEAEQVVVVSGMQQALDILARLLLNAGDEVVVETPGYTAAFELFRLHGARLTAVPVDDHGLDVTAIPETSRARLAFVTPSNQFPRGGTMPFQRRLALLNWARRHNTLLLEDDYDGELRYDNHPIPALQGLDREGRVVYLGTFSKVLFPALRLGYVVLPPSLLQPFLQAKGLLDRGSPTLTQAAVADFISEGHFERHLQRLRQEYGERRQVLVDALAKQLGERVHWAPAAAGLHVMVYLDEGCDEAQVVRQAAAAGVGVYPGAPYHLQRPSPPSILLGFSGLNPAEIKEGVRRLAGVVNG